MSAVEQREILVHLNVAAPVTDTRTADEIADAITGALEVGSDDDSVRDLTIVAPLAEDIGVVPEGIEPTTPVVVVTRHPDASNEIGVHGFRARVIDIDLGSSFDGQPDDDEQAREWAESVLHSVRDLPNDHPGRLEVESVVRNTCDRLDGDELTEIVQRHRRA